MGLGLREYRWRDYLLVDGWTYRQDRGRLLFAGDCEVLSNVRARQVLERILREHSALCHALLEDYGKPHYKHEQDALSALTDLLGSPLDPFAAEVHPFARLIVFRRKPPKPIPLPAFEMKCYEPAPLTDVSSWVCVECVDDSEAERPVPNTKLEVTTAAGEVRVATTDAKGFARIDGIAAGNVTIRLLGLDGYLWRPLAGEDSKPSAASDRFIWHEVRQGECLSKIADRYGFKYWQDVWRFGKNKDLREKRKSPHVLFIGDLLAVPVLRLYEMQRQTEQTHRIEVKRHGQVHLRLSLHDFNGVPFDRESCELALEPPEDEPRCAQTDAEGMLEVKVPATTQSVRVRCAGVDFAWDLALSELNPADGGESRPIEGAEGKCMPAYSTVSGLKARLNALGYDAMPLCEPWTEQAAAALAWFQASELVNGSTDAWDDDLDAALRDRVGA